MQETLVVGIGKFTVDISKVRVYAPPVGFTGEDPLICHVNNPADGVHVAGEHNSDVTDLLFLYGFRIASHLPHKMAR
jgi:hypothetical protein